MRKTKVGAFEKIDIKEVTEKQELKYDRKTGYLGTGVAGDLVAAVSPFDRILVVKQNGTYSVSDVTEKAFVGAGAWWIGVADKEALAGIIFTVIYKDAANGCAYIKRCIIEGWIMNKDYSLIPENAETLYIDTRQKFVFTARYKPKPRLKVLEESFKAHNYSVRGLKAGGLRLSNKEVHKIEPGK